MWQRLIDLDHCEPRNASSYIDVRPPLVSSGGPETVAPFSGAKILTGQTPILHRFVELERSSRHD
jgi:hypothetical protein